jgi:uncharacterized membrane protein YqjE
MAYRQQIQTDDDGRPLPAEEPGLGDMLRRLADDAGQLVRSEVALAKLEMKEAGRAYALGGVRLAVALGMAGLGGMALTAALVLGLGLVMGGLYWASALIVGVFLLLIGGVLAKRGVDRIKETELKPEETIRTLREDKRWAAREAREMKQALRE